MTARTDQAASAVAQAMARLAEVGQDAFDQAHTLLFAVEQAGGAGAVARFVAAMVEQADQAEAESDDKEEEDGGSDMSAVVEARKALAIAGAHLLAAIKPTDEEQDEAMERLKEGGWALDDEHAAWSADVAEAVLTLREEEGKKEGE